MSSLDATNLPPVINPTVLPSDVPASSNETAAATAEQTTVGLPSATTTSSASGLLQNFILPKTALDALGLLKPSNQGDSEVLVAQASLTAEELADDSEATEASALSAMAATNAGIFGAIQLQIATLRAQNNAAQDRIASNNGQINAIDNQISQNAQALGDLEDQQRNLNNQIADLEAVDPQTDEIVDQIRALQQQLSGVNASIADLNNTIEDLQGERSSLASENAEIQNEITGREQTILVQTQLVELLGSLLERFIDASQGVNETIDDAQKETELETSEVVLESILPDLQQVFEIDLEDAGLETVLSETRLDNRETEEAITVSFGLVGSFFESLGLFLQLSNLVELDLDSTAFGNNKSQRMQISI